MSLDYSVYVGPYVECKIGMKKSLKKTRVCPNTKCLIRNSNPNTKFCPDCGFGIVETTEEIEVEEVCLWDIREALHDTLIFPFGDSARDVMIKKRCHVYIPNVSYLEDRKHSFDPKYELRWSSFKPEDIDEEINLFLVRFKNEMLVLNKNYGAENIEVKWGVVNDIS